MRHRRRGRLAVGAAHGNAPAIAEQPRQHLAAMQYGYAEPRSCAVFRIAPIDRRADDNRMRLRTLTRIVTDRDLTPSSRNCSTSGVRQTSEPETGSPRANNTRAIALMPMPPTPTKWYAFTARSFEVPSYRSAPGCRRSRRPLLSARRSARARPAVDPRPWRRAIRPTGLAASSASVTITAAPALGNARRCCLMAFGGKRIRHEDCRLSKCRQFRQGRGAGARQHRSAAA